MTAGQIRRGALALAVLATGSLAHAAEPSIPLRVSLIIPEICTIGSGARGAADADMPSVSCVHGTPFVLSHAPLPDLRSAPRSVGAGVPPAWTVTF
ncbi:hypothetical protein [Burkholderia arboris]|uniref:Lipoprotein n=1 Tax=Burkholderia arboris TaxID=488730 RepID=A0A9Q9SG80_9BURK|nr:hypothetical protein [Burkholderia arboris]UTV56018.1 hypothetical protein NLX30_06460 [Burkholderia arboris]VWB38092.1 hypothetical protein BAR24066_01679 [Burkholderia arboris]